MFREWVMGRKTKEGISLIVRTVPFKATLGNIDVQQVQTNAQR
jgi:predicted transcriptional regulator